MSRIVAVSADQNPPCRQDLVTVAAEAASAAVAHWYRPSRAVGAYARIRFEHARHGPVLEEHRRLGVVVEALASPGYLAEEQPFVEPVVDIISLGPAAAVARQLQCRGRTRAPVGLEAFQDGQSPFVFIICCVACQADAPVLVAVPAVVKYVGLAANVRINGGVDVPVKLRPLAGRPVLITQIVNDRTSRQIVREGNVTGPDRPFDIFHRHLHGGFSERAVILDCTDQRH